MADEQLETCPACGSASPEGASYCPTCGHRIADDVDATAHADRRLFGVVSPVAAFVLGCLLLVGALAAGVLGSMVGAILLLAAAGAVFVIFYGAAERDPSSTVARGAVRGKDQARAWTSATRSSAQAYVGAGRDVIRVRQELRALRKERARLKEALADAAFRADHPTVVSLRARMLEIDEAVGRGEREKVEAVSRAREQMEEERAAARRTEVLPPADVEPAEAPSPNEP